MRILPISLMSIVVSACAVTLSFSDIKTGGTIELVQPLNIAPNDARVFLQYGKVVSYKEIKRYYPHCWFVSWQRKNEAQVITPDSFNIIKVVEKIEIVSNKSGGFKLASLVIQGDTPISEYITEIHLSSVKQPDVRRLICSHWEDPMSAMHLTGAQIQQALGDYAKVNSE